MSRKVKIITTTVYDLTPTGIKPDHSQFIPDVVEYLDTKPPEKPPTRTTYEERPPRYVSPDETIRPMTPGQVIYIRDLGGKPGDVQTVEEADQLIKKLKELREMKRHD